LGILYREKSPRSFFLEENAASWENQLPFYFLYISANQLAARRILELKGGDQHGMRELIQRSIRQQTLKQRLEPSIVVFYIHVLMGFDWPNVLLGAVLGAVLGVLGDWQIGGRLRAASEHARKKRKYGHLAGIYANFRLKENETQEATGGRIKLTWRKNGSFEVKGLHENGVTEWEGRIRMSEEWENSGTGFYQYVGSEKSDAQQIIYVANSRFFHVVTTPNVSKPVSFMHL